MIRLRLPHADLHTSGECLLIFQESSQDPRSITNIPQNSSPPSSPNSSNQSSTPPVAPSGSPIQGLSFVTQELCADAVRGIVIAFEVLRGHFSAGREEHEGIFFRTSWRGCKNDDIQEGLRAFTTNPILSNNFSIMRLFHTYSVYA